MTYPWRGGERAETQVTDVDTKGKTNQELIETKMQTIKRGDGGTTKRDRKRERERSRH